MVAALYAALVIVLAPISFGPIQLRIADCLMPLSVVFGWPAIWGLSLGAFIGNAYFMQFTGLIDVVFGALANLVAGIVMFRLRKTPILAFIAGSVVIGVIVGGYLWIYFPPPVMTSVPILGMIVSITLSSLVAVVGLGSFVAVAAERATVTK